MHVMVAGLRGFPYVQGGVESHSEHLYPELVELGYQVTVIVRPAYQVYRESTWKGVRFKRIWAPRSPTLEAVVHTFLAVIYAGFRRPDVLHIHAIGPSLAVPLARLFLLQVVMTHHGPDYDREKWNGLARFALRLGERLGVTLAQQRIVISPVIEEIVNKKYHLSSHVIPNGVELPTICDTTRDLRKHGLQPQKFVLLVSRFVPEKRHFDLLDAFEEAHMDGWKLVFVGTVDHISRYGEEVRRRANETEGVVCTGFLTDNALAEVYSHAGLFVLPSSHEGLCIALLDALSYGLKCIASDIAANRAVGLDSNHYFRLGSTTELAEKMRQFSGTDWSLGDRQKLRASTGKTFSWKRNARDTFTVYQLIGCRRKSWFF
jgi:glycosyltransferase involved in cell wall biosynthesis